MVAQKKTQVRGNQEVGFELSLGDLTSAIRRNLWLVALALVVTFAGAVGYGMSRTRIYRATATLQIDPKPPTPLGRGVEGVVELGTGNYWANVEYYNTQHELIRSLPVTAATVRELGLHSDPSFFSNTLEPPGDSYVDRLSPEAAVELAARLVRARLSVAPSDESRLVTVSYDDANRRRATRILDAILRNYIAHNVSRAVDSTSSAVEWLGEQLEGLRSELSASELALHEYKLEKQIASVGIDDQTDILQREIAQLATQRTTVRTKIQEALARVAQLRSIETTSPEKVPKIDFLTTPELNQLRSEYMANMREKRSLTESGKGENHPQVLALTARLNATKQSFTSEIQNIKDGAERELAALRQEEGGIRSLLQEAEKKALELNLMEIEYSRLRRTKENNEKLYGLVLERSKEAGLTRMLKVNNIHVLSPAAASGAPVEPRLTLILAAGALGGLALGLMLALGREQMDRTIKSAAELESRLHLTPLATVPHVSDAPSVPPIPRRRRRKKTGSASPELLTESNPTSGFSESFRTLRTNLLFMAPDKPFRRILITSASPAEGKTTMACSLAITMAKMGQRVLLVDCDLRKPRLHTVFPRIRLTATLSESLMDMSLLDYGNLGTEISGLSLLPSGPCPPNPTELLHSKAFSHLLQKLDEKFDLIVLDSPPLVVSDAAIIATQVDGAILVTRSRKSHRGEVARAVRAIKTVGGNVIGAILNASRRADESYGYGYGYGHYGPTYGASVPPPSKS